MALRSVQLAARLVLPVLTAVSGPVVPLALMSGSILICPTAARAADDVAASREKAVAFLKTSQLPEGAWTAPDALGITGLVTYGLLEAGVPPTDPVIQKAIKHLLTFSQPDGGIYNPKSHHGNYETGITAMALSKANTNKQYDDVLAKAQSYVRKAQWDATESIDKSDIRWGGAGYGRSGDRPDLSNTAFFLDALAATGATKDDPAVQNAVVFLSRCQNLESEYNTTPFASKINDGGFYYTPAAGGTSVAGKDDNGGLRSYGSMTYTGLRSMIFAGLKKDDPRIKAASEWIAKHYSVDENPGLGDLGLYYYYQTFGKTMQALGTDEFTDAAGKKHNWREELTHALVSRQQENGSWVNKANRFMEGDPNLVTAYALITFATTKK